MTRTDICRENAEALAELKALAPMLDEADLARAVGSWTVATSLCHVAFWDRRALAELSRWRTTGTAEAVRMDPRSVESINAAVNAIALAVPGPAALSLAVDAAETVDAFIASLGDALVGQIASAGFERYLRRSLHRREHIRAIREVLSDSATAPETAL